MSVPRVHLKKRILNREYLFVAVLALSSAFFTQWQSVKIGNLPYINTTWNAWFSADSPRAFANAALADSDHAFRSELHPLYAFLLYPPIRGVTLVFAVPAASAMKFALAFNAGLWMAMMYILLRLIGCRLLDAALFTILARVSASAMFWLCVPETFPFGSSTLLFALIIAGIRERLQGTRAKVLSVFATALTFSMTITNGMVGLIALFFGSSFRRATSLCLTSLIVLLGFWRLQLYLFQMPFQIEKIFRQGKEVFVGLGVLHNLKSFLFHSLVMPAIVGDLPPKEGAVWPRMITQPSLPGSGSIWGLISVSLWALLLIGGFAALVSQGHRVRLRTMILFTLIGQFVLHMVYGGGETFLYSSHWLPFLVAISALAGLTAWRKTVLLLSALLLFTTGMNNLPLFFSAARAMQLPDRGRFKYVNPLEPFGAMASSAMNAHPLSATDKCGIFYSDGSLVPDTDSFRLTFFSNKADGVEPQRTRPENQSDERCVNLDMVTVTPNFKARWRTQGPGVWRLELDRLRNSNAIYLTITNSGPLGSPLWSIFVDPLNRINANYRWYIEIQPLPREYDLGDKKMELGSWTGKRNSTSDSGNAFGIWRFDEGNHWEIKITDSLNRFVATPQQLLRPKSRP